MDFYGTVGGVQYFDDHVLLKCLNGRVSDQRPWLVRLSPTNYNIRTGDAIDIVSDVAYWTTAQAEAASVNHKPTAQRYGRERFENIVLELRTAPWIEKT